MPRLSLPAAALATLFAATAALGQPPAPDAQRIPTISRAVMQFAGLERELAEAVRAHDAARLRLLLAEDFEQRDANAPDQPTPRAEWLAHLPPTFADAAQQRFAVHDYGDTAVVSFTLTLPTNDSRREVMPADFVVDIWRKSGERWQLAARYLGAGDAARVFPGSAPQQAPPKKF
ncbi:MAG TPA: nuclear transport factor 2 family protein [Mizugakiibacter sp.]